jgi:hypothetical protein
MRNATGLNLAVLVLAIALPHTASAGGLATKAGYRIAVTADRLGLPELGHEAGRLAAKVGQRLSWTAMAARIRAGQAKAGVQTLAANLRPGRRIDAVVADLKTRQARNPAYELWEVAMLGDRPLRNRKEINAFVDYVAGNPELRAPMVDRLKRVGAIASKPWRDALVKLPELSHLGVLPPL